MELKIPYQITHLPKELHSSLLSSGEHGHIQFRKKSAEEQSRIPHHDGNVKSDGWVNCGSKVARWHAKAGKEMPTFSFLGVLHVWGQSMNRERNEIFWRMKRRTDPKRFRKKLAEIKTHLMERLPKSSLLVKKSNNSISCEGFLASSNNAGFL